MEFKVPLQKATLVRRYKRFLSDMLLPNGTKVVAHCANSGSMLGLTEPGSEVWLSPNTNPKAKLDWRWELVRIDGQLVGINTSNPNRIVEAAIEGDEIAELRGYKNIRREVRYGLNSRIDLLLEAPDKEPCFVEVKNVTLKRKDHAEFPDAETKRGEKHLRELACMRADGNRALMFYLVQRGDCNSFRLAADIDPAYKKAFFEARDAGVEAVCYACAICPTSIRIVRQIPIDC
ncbi:MAG: DNA/RNA nuclease SfsA [Rhodospirillaceae bacterium]|nr:DNA/RNA nuclease SfsA [Rhodospirillaceae bacterium]|tara:strand:- start:3458 stop:4156 length:699 start_codon:yes stop_codon:yes gene_type:complete